MGRDHYVLMFLRVWSIPDATMFLEFDDKFCIANYLKKCMPEKVDTLGDRQEDVTITIYILKIFSRQICSVACI